MISFLFWNLNKKPLDEVIEQLARYYNIDILIFTEMISHPNEILTSLNSNGKSDYFYIPNIIEGRFHIFTRFSSEFVKPVYDENRMTIRSIELPGRISILLAVTHIPSKLRWDDADQDHECTNLSQFIRDREKEYRHSRTVLVGDMNMNPFQPGMVSSHGFHGVMCQKIAKKEYRVVQQRQYPFFYNPMWNLFGDKATDVPGTYYYNSSRPVEYFWNMFDQVLIRPDLIDRFLHEDLKIIKNFDDQTLLNEKGVPEKDKFSDHLPLYFKINLHV